MSEAATSCGNDGGAQVPPKRAHKHFLTCTRCKEEGKPPVLSLRNEALCRDCHVRQVDRKFARATPVKNAGRGPGGRYLEKGEKVLLALSGGLGSRSLLALAQSNLNSKGFERFERKFEGLSALYVDETQVYKLCSPEEASKAREALAHLCSDTATPFSVIPLHHVFCTESECDPSALHTPHQEEEMKARLAALFNCLGKSLTAQEDTLEAMRTRVILDWAQRQSIRKVLFGDTCDRLAERVIAHTCRGTASALKYLTDSKVSGDNEVVILRPLRDLLRKEVAMYLHLKSLDVVFYPNLHTRRPVKSSIQKLTATFVSRIQSEYDNAVQPLIAIAGKLSGLQPATASSTSQGDGSVFCAICTLPFRPKDLQIAPPPATGTTAQVSQASDDCCESGGGGCGGGGQAGGTCGGGGGGSESAAPTEGPVVCYGCTQIIKDIQAASGKEAAPGAAWELYPAYVVDKARASVKREAMRESIQEFLLDEEND